MRDNGLTYAFHDIQLAGQGQCFTHAVARRVFQGIGGCACLALSAMMPWAEFSSSGITFANIRLPLPLLAFTGMIVAIGLMFFAASVWGLVRRLAPHTRFGVLVIGGLTLLSFAGIEYGVIRTDGFSAFAYRPAARLIGYTGGIALLACSIPEAIGPRLAYLIHKHPIGWRSVLGLAALSTSAGALIGVWVLDGMPHIIDGTSYLLQSRTLWSGQLAIAPPMHLELFEHELMQFRVTDAGYFSKYPAGWPLLLGLFDSLGTPWLANALLAGALVLVTYLFVKELSSKRVAGLSAAIVALCPWLWMNAGTMMPHLASAVWLWLFMWLLLVTIRTQSRAAALLSGLALGTAALTRPADAAFFALPAMIATLGWIWRRPEAWLTRLPLVYVGAVPGAVVYLWMNRTLSGGGSTYGDGHGQMLLSQLPKSPMHAIAWVQESWVGVSTQWFAGALPMAAMVLCGLVFGRSYLRRHWLAMACAASLLLGYGVFVFGGRAWVGPRWYVPLIPALAMLVAAGLCAAARAGRLRSASGILAAGYLRTIPVAVVVLLLVVLPVKVVELVNRTPHGIDGRVVELAERAGLTNAVVALPESGLDPTTGQPNYKRGIAGMWAMQTPFEDSEVIYISAVDGWEQMAAEAWPNRHLLALSDKAGDYRFVEVINRHTTPYKPKP